VRDVRALLAAVTVMAVVAVACGAGEQSAGQQLAVIGVDAEPEVLNPYAAPGELPIIYEVLTATRTPPYVQGADQTWAHTSLLAGEAAVTTDP
jgi:ABC-type sugar transport system substrate-binding protein